MNCYSYQELLEKSSSINSTKEDRIKLYNWFENYGYDFWNGECFEIDKSRNLYPVYEILTDEDGEEEYILVDCEIR